MPEPEGNAPRGPEAALGHRRATTRHDGYRFSQRARKRIEEVFGWAKTVGGGRKLRYRGIARNRLWVEMTIAGYNLVRLAKLTAATARAVGSVCPEPAHHAGKLQNRPEPSVHQTSDPGSQTPAWDVRTPY